MTAYSDTHIRRTAVFALILLLIAGAMYFRTQKEDSKWDKLTIGILIAIVAYSYVMIITKPYSENNMRTFFMVTAGASSLLLFRIAKKQHVKHEEKKRKKSNSGKSTETKFISK